MHEGSATPAVGGAKDVGGGKAEASISGGVGISMEEVHATRRAAETETYAQADMNTVEARRALQAETAFLTAFLNRHMRCTPTQCVDPSGELAEHHANPDTSERPRSQSCDHADDEPADEQCSLLLHAHMKATFEVLN